MDTVLVVAGRFYKTYFAVLNDNLADAQWTCDLHGAVLIEAQRGKNLVSGTDTYFARRLIAPQTCEQPQHKCSGKRQYQKVT